MVRNKDSPYIDLLPKKGNVTLEVTMKESPGDEEKLMAIAKKRSAGRRRDDVRKGTGVLTRLT